MRNNAAANEDLPSRSTNNPNPMTTLYRQGHALNTRGPSLSHLRIIHNNGSTTASTRFNETLQPLREVPAASRRMLVPETVAVLPNPQ